MANELPTLAELQGTYGYGDPRAYQQARENQALASMFQGQNLQQEQIKTQQDQESYNHSVLNNPLTREQTQLGNVGQQQKNETGALQLQRDYALQGQKLQQDQYDAIIKLKDADFRVMEQHGQELLQNPDTYADGAKILEATKEAYMLKQKHDREMEIVRLKGDYDIKGRGISAQAGGSGGGKKTGSLADYTKLTADKARTAAAATLASGMNPYTMTPLSDVETLFLESMKAGSTQNFNAALAAKAGQGLVMSATPEGKIIPTNKAPVQVSNIPVEGQTKSGIKFKVLPQ